MASAERSGWCTTVQLKNGLTIEGLDVVLDQLRQAGYWVFDSSLEGRYIQLIAPALVNEPMLRNVNALLSELGFLVVTDQHLDWGEETRLR